jgi:hypothetical protein
MAHAQPTSIDNKGDGSRVSTAATWFIAHLFRLVPRVQELYWAWKLTHAKKADMENGLQAVGRPIDVKSQAFFDDKLLEGTQRFVENELHLDDDGWIAAALLDYFRFVLHHEQHPEDTTPWFIPVVVLPETAPGKGPPHGGEALALAVEWHVRLNVKKENVHALARERCAALGLAEYDDDVRGAMR